LRRKKKGIKELLDKRIMEDLRKKNKRKKVFTLIK